MQVSRACCCSCKCCRSCCCRCCTPATCPVFLAVRVFSKYTCVCVPLLCVNLLATQCRCHCRCLLLAIDVKPNQQQYQRGQQQPQLLILGAGNDSTEQHLSVSQARPMNCCRCAWVDLLTNGGYSKVLHQLKVQL